MVPWRGTPHGKRAGRITMGRNLFYFIGALPRKWKHLLLAQLISDLAVRRERIRIEVCHKDFLMPKPKRAILSISWKKRLVCQAGQRGTVFPDEEDLRRSDDLDASN